MLNTSIHHLFPTLLTETKYDMNQKILDIIYDNWKTHYTNGYSNEGTGNLDIHTDESFKDLYIFLNKCVIEYLKLMGISSENFNINFVKSWFNSLENIPTPMHCHADAHISVVYYAQTPPSTDQIIRFNDRNESRELFYGAARNNSFEMNEFNSSIYSVAPAEGTALVFPARVYHDTIGENKGFHKEEPPVNTENDLRRKRICIASDVVLTYKEKSSKSLGLQPISQWRTF